MDVAQWRALAGGKEYLKKWVTLFVERREVEAGLLVPWAVPNSPIPLGLFAHEPVPCFWPITWPDSVSVCELCDPRLNPAWASEHVPVTSFMAKEGSTTPTPDVRWTHEPEVSHLTCV